MSFVDQIGNSIELHETPKRIISLVPSQTEFLFDIGLADQIIGITKFCIWPEEFFRTKEKIGGTKTLNLEKIRALQPDLIIANKEENERAQIEILQREFPVWTSDISTLGDALDMMHQLGIILDREQQAEGIIQSITRSFDTLIPSTSKTCLYLIWREPYMVAGTGTFIDDMLKKIGCINVAPSDRYPSLTLAEIRELQADLILLSSEPYPFKQVHIEEIQAVCLNSKVMLVDGEMFSWYGSRLQHSVKYFKTLMG